MTVYIFLTVSHQLIYEYLIRFSFYGFCIDVLERASKIIGFNYILDLVQDKKVRICKFNQNIVTNNCFLKYGAKNPVTGEWNGKVGFIQRLPAHSKGL